MVAEWFRGEDVPLSNGIGEGQYTRFLAAAERAYAGFFG
jgi:hypothetical protein